MTDTPFHDLDAYLGLPRLSGLALSPDGTRLVTTVAVLDPKATTYVSAVWEVDPAGKRPSRRLTRAAKGESGAAFAADGSVLFVSGRPDPQAADDDDADGAAAVWRLPPGGGEAAPVAKRPGGIVALATARSAPVLAVVSPTLPSAVTAQDDAARRKERKDRSVAAVLHETYPVREWDHDLGPDAPRLLVGDLPESDAQVSLRDLTPAPGRSLTETQVDLAPDGTWLAATWRIPEAGGLREAVAVVPAGAEGTVRLLLDDVDTEFTTPRISPDGLRLACIGQTRSTATRPPARHVTVVDVATGTRRTLALDSGAWANDLAWAPDGAALVVAADEQGAAPLLRLDLATGGLTRLTGDRAAYTDPVLSPDGRHVYALRAAVDAPPAPVRLDSAAPDQSPVLLPAPAPAPALPGRLTEVSATAEDGQRLRGWLVLPGGATQEHPAPLLLWIHGGPLGSWNSWSWRWNPWLAAAAGYAVLLPDPALSVGYGQVMIQRGWGAWGAAPYTDLLTLTDAALARPDLDAARTAAMGGSFGGYMANWVATHTDRFRGIVSHAGLWALDQFASTTDASYYWLREFTPQMVLENSPHLFVEEIRTPMLVIHGDKDYRVPVGEALRLWSDLTRTSAGEDGSTPHTFLYFPDENHWVLKPQNAKVWYVTVFAFLATTVLGEPWVVPEILR